MKHSKRLLALVLTLTLAFGLAVPAMANNAPVNPSEPTGNWLIDTLTGWADSIAQRLIDGISPQELANCGEDNVCIFSLVWRNVRPWVIGGAVIFAVATVITVVVIVLAVRMFNAG